MHIMLIFTVLERNKSTIKLEGSKLIRESLYD